MTDEAPQPSRDEEAHAAPLRDRLTAYVARAGADDCAQTRSDRVDVLYRSRAARSRTPKASVGARAPPTQFGTDLGRSMLAAPHANIRSFYEAIKQRPEHLHLQEIADGPALAAEIAAYQHVYNHERPHETIDWASRSTATPMAPTRPRRPLPTRQNVPIT